MQEHCQKPAGSVLLTICLTDCGLRSIHIQLFLLEGHISCYTTVENRTSYVMWLFRDMLHSTKSANVSQKLYFFITDKMSARPGELSSRAGFGSQAVVWSRPETNWLDKSDNKFCTLYKKIKTRAAVNIFLLYFYGNAVLHAVSCLIGCLPELSDDNNQPSTTSHVSTNWPTLTSRIHSDTKACFCSEL